jgi:Fe2+ or Zn2+ uptake regulation protein
VDPTQDIELKEAIRSTGRRVTPQRLVLLDALRRLGRHASAEEVMHEAAPHLPGLSLPTVYATLDLFDELGVARRVDPGVGPALYDPLTDGHGHFACRECGRVVDLEGATDTAALAEVARSAGLRVDATQVLLTGLCDRCSQAAPAR